MSPKIEMPSVEKMPSLDLPVTPDMIAAAAVRIAPSIRRTPLLTVAAADFGGDVRLQDVQLKLEFLQHAGSFKPRGAFNTLLSAGAIPKIGVAAASGGNHGAAVAFAAQRLGHRATIFVPEIASPAKIAAIKAFGADVRIGGARYNDALAACTAFVAQSGALSVHAYDAVPTIAGQGTVASEWATQAGGDMPDTVLVAVGGGGLIAGMAAWWRGRVKVVGVEPSGSKALHAALAANAPVDVSVESVAGDSLGAKRVGTLNFAIAQACVDHVVLVDDAAIIAAQATLWRTLRIASEPGGAAALAALLSGAYVAAPGETVGVLLCGANVGLSSLA
jgi:threonine dehydratase